MDNTNQENVQRALPIIRRLALEAGTVDDAAERATRGARALLPYEILRPSVIQPSTLWLDLAIAHRATANDDTLAWTPGMEEIGPDLLALTGCESELRTRALQETRTALVRQPRTPLEQGLLKLLESAAAIVGGKHSALSIRVTSLFQGMPAYEVEPWQPTSGARIKSGPTEIAVLTDPECEITAVELRLHEGMWRLPSVFGKPLLAQFEALHRHRR